MQSGVCEEEEEWQFIYPVFFNFTFQVCEAQDSGGLNPEEEIISFGRSPVADGVFSPIVTASCRAGKTFSLK